MSNLADAFIALLAKQFTAFADVVPGDHIHYDDIILLKKGQQN